MEKGDPKIGPKQEWLISIRSLDERYWKKRNLKIKWEYNSIMSAAGVPNLHSVEREPINLVASDQDKV